MHNDIVIEVIDKIKSGKPILVMQAILTGIEAKITDEAFIEEIKNNKDNEICLLNIPIGYVAKAALDVLGKETYMGSNEYILKMIRDFKNGTIKTEWWISYYRTRSYSSNNSSFLFYLEVISYHWREVNHYNLRHP